MRKISDDLLEDMTRRLVDQFQPEQVILFGSQAWGVPDQYSDVDLMVIVDNSDLSDYTCAVQAHHCLSDLNMPKDVIVKTRAEFEFFRDVRGSLEHKVYKQGKVLYERSQKTTGRQLAHESAT